MKDLRICWLLLGLRALLLGVRSGLLAILRAFNGRLAHFHGEFLQHHLHFLLELLAVLFGLQFSLNIGKRVGLFSTGGNRATGRTQKRG